MKKMYSPLQALFLFSACVILAGCGYTTPPATDTQVPTTNTVPTVTSPPVTTPEPVPTVVPTPEPAPTAVTPTPKPAVITPKPKSVPQPVSISIQNFAFSSGNLTVAAGTRVTWTNKDSMGHTVTSDSGAFDSGSLANGASYSFTFDQAGTFAYHCAFHPSMTATIVVTQ